MLPLGHAASFLATWSEMQAGAPPPVGLLLPTSVSRGVPIRPVLVLSPQRREGAPPGRCCLQQWARYAAQVGCGPSTRGCALPPGAQVSPHPHRLLLAFLGWGDPRASAGGREQGSRHLGGHCSPNPGSSREPRRAPCPALLRLPRACLSRFGTRSPGAEALSPASLSPPPHYLSLSASCLYRRSVRFLLASQDPAGPRAPAPGTPPPPLPASPPSGLPLSLAAPGARVTAPRPPRTPPLPQAVPPPRRLREGTGWGRRRPPPTSEAPWAGGGGPAPGASASLLPGTGPRGARPDGLHRELGVLRGAGARAPLRPPTSGEPPGELPGPGAGPVPGARGVGARREQAAPASGRRCGDGCGEWVAGRAHPAHLRQVRSPARKGPVSCWEGGSKGRLPQGPGLDEDLVKAQS